MVGGWRRWWWGLAAIAWMAAGCGLAGSSRHGQVKAAPAGRLKVLAFYATGDHEDLSSVYKYPQAVGTFVPFWYSVQADGTLKSHLDPTVLDRIRASGIPITPLINDGTGRQTFLESATTRIEAARNIADVVGSEHFQGVNIDFEPPVAHLSRQLVSFMTDLRDMLPRQDIITLSIVPTTGGEYNFPKLRPEVNQFVLMSYDLHDDGSLPGPVAPVPWVQNILQRLLRAVPASQVYLGIPLYGYIWPQGSTHATTLPYSALTPLLNARAEWNGRYDETYAKFTQGGQSYIAWWESLQGVNEKIQLAKRYHLAGVALWRLGYQTDAVMQLLLHQIGSQR